MALDDMQNFFTWFKSHNGELDASSMDVIQFPASEGGRGAVALKDIPEGHVIFTIPRSLILSTRTCMLPQKFGLDSWKKSSLHQGWAGLILCMMWEAAQGSQSRWSAYLDFLPKSFDTPIFWGEDDLAELKGTCVVEKIGREQAERDYREKVLPAVQSRPDLFASQNVEQYYSIEMYHLMGSRVLSRSFTLSREEDDHENDVDDSSMGSAMDIDGPLHKGASATDDSQKGDNEEEGEDEEEEETEVVMIPLADILNARYETENVKLFYEQECLKMIATKLIKSGEQIWNTYGDLPNAALLRSYGHVDYLSLPDGGYGNPGDVVEIRADLVVSTIMEDHGDFPGENMDARIDWWLEAGGDDVFVLEFDLEIPPALTSFIRLIQINPEWEKAQNKKKPPKPKTDVQTLSIIRNVLVKRLAQYSTTLKEDEALLPASASEPVIAAPSLSLNRRHAIIVRMGEKRILNRLLEKTNAILASAAAQASTSRENGNNGKRKVPISEKEGMSKKVRENIQAS
ncbi:SET domain-containing protein [Phlegmacium glaucopus]|nr:SET domain-containing protein [Phlegmacium glaucopus]